MSEGRTEGMKGVFGEISVNGESEVEAGGRERKKWKGFRLGRECRECDEERCKGGSKEKGKRVEKIG